MIRFATLLAAMLVMATTAQASTNLIVNPSFGTGDLTGWHTYYWYVEDQTGGIKPPTGDRYFATASSYTHQFSVLQQIVPTKTGETYNLSFSFNGGYANQQMFVNWDGFFVLAGLSGPLGWETITIDGLYGRTTSTNLLFEIPDSQGEIGLDDVVLTSESAAVPDVSTWVLMLLGFGMVGFVMRKRSPARARASAA